MADAHGSGPCARKGVRVQLPPSPPKSPARCSLTGGAVFVLTCAQMAPGRVAHAPPLIRRLPHALLHAAPRSADVPRATRPIPASRSPGRNLPTSLRHAPPQRPTTPSTGRSSPDHKITGPESANEAAAGPAKRPTGAITGPVWPSSAPPYSPPGDLMGNGLGQACAAQPHAAHSRRPRGRSHSWTTSTETPQARSPVGPRPNIGDSAYRKITGRDSANGTAARPPGDQPARSPGGDAHQRSAIFPPGDLGERLGAGGAAHHIPPYSPAARPFTVSRQLDRPLLPPQARSPGRIPPTEPRHDPPSDQPARSPVRDAHQRSAIFPSGDLGGRLWNRRRRSPHSPHSRQRRDP